MGPSRRQMQPFTRRWSGGKPSVTVVLVAIHAGAFAAQLVFELLLGNRIPYTGWLLDMFGLTGDAVRDGRWWQLFTFPCLHASPWPFHLLANMLLLYFAGREVEPIVGSRHFLALYGVGTLVGGVFHYLVMPADSLVGVSAGVAAVIAAYSTILPELEISLNVFFILPLRLRAKYLALAVVGLGAVLWATMTAPIIGPAAMLAGAFVGWVYVKQLGFGNPLAVQRYIFEKRQRAQRLERMSAEQFVSAEIDPILDKIAREGMHSLTRSERKILAKGREKIAAKTSGK
jgi:membrane associated rhomboid family serine protease